MVTFRPKKSLGPAAERQAPARSLGSIQSPSAASSHLLCCLFERTQRSTSTSSRAEIVHQVHQTWERAPSFFWSKILGGTIPNGLLKPPKKIALHPTPSPPGINGFLQLHTIGLEKHRVLWPIGLVFHHSARILLAPVIF